MTTKIIGFINSAGEECEMEDPLEMLLKHLGINVDDFIAKTSGLPKQYKCVLCNYSYDDYGNNPQPLSDKGRCCSSCNQKVLMVRKYRIKHLPQVKPRAPLSYSEEVRWAHLLPSED